ncbi:MAG: GLUG motif-containing protein [Sedimentisphaerales bacterium]
MNNIGSQPNDWNKYFLLINDIDMSVYSNNEYNVICGDSTDGWYTMFEGVFDGNGHIIRNLKLNIGGMTGLFGYIGLNGIVRNVWLEGINIKSNCYVGGIAGRNEGIIQNCHVSGIIECEETGGGITGYCFGTSSQIRSCSFKGRVSGTYGIVGGIVGSIDSPEIAKCYAIAEITGEHVCGGIVGDNMGGNFEMCYAKGAVTCSSYGGGFAASTHDHCGYGGNIKNCYANVIVNCSETAGGFSGSFPGMYGEIWNCYCSGKVIYDVNNHSDVGGFIGENITTPSGVFNSYFLETSGPDNGFGEPLSDEQMKQQASFINWDFVNTWQMCICGQGYPCLRWQCPAYIYSGGSGTETDPYRIATVCDWQQLMNTPADWNQCFLLTADVNLQGITLTPIGIYDYFNPMPFTGVFDGNSHIIYNVDMNKPTSDYIGLFSYVSSGQIRNLGIVDVNIIGDEYVGGLVGLNYDGSIINCYSTGVVSGSSDVGGLVGKSSQSSISNCYSTCTIYGSNGHSNVGGLIGLNGIGSLTNCYATGNINFKNGVGSGGGSTYVGVGGLVGSNYSYEENGIIACYATGTITGKNGGYVGGLVGYNDNHIMDCYATGDVNVIGSSVQFIGGLVGFTDSGSRNVITNSYATGAVNTKYSNYGGHYVGGLMGYNNGTITACYAAGSVNGRDDIGGLVGYNNDTITACYATGSVNGNEEVGGLAGRNGRMGPVIIDCYTTATVTGRNYVGGLAGTNLYTITDCYAAGAVVGDSNVGGLTSGNGGSINACFWDVNTSGQATSDGGEGKTTEEMKMLSTFTSAGWDFSYNDGDEAIWFMQIDEYPILTWQISPADIYTDGRNNFRDFAIFAQYWMREDCRVYNDYCDFADLNFDGSVDFDDLIELMSYWLETGIYE